MRPGRRGRPSGRRLLKGPRGPPWGGGDAGRPEKSPAGGAGTGGKDEGSRPKASGGEADREERGEEGLSLGVGSGDVLDDMGPVGSERSLKDGV